MEIIMSNKSIPLTITKYYDGTECMYTLTKVIPSKETIAAIESFDNNVLFENIINKYFILGPNAKCTKDDVQALIWEQAACDSALFIGFDFTLSNLQYCEHYRAFLKYITSLDGVKETRFRGNGQLVRGFKGIGIKYI